MFPDLVDFVGAVAVAGVGEELKILMLRGEIDDFFRIFIMSFARGKVWRSFPTDPGGCSVVCECPGSSLE